MTGVQIVPHFRKVQGGYILTDAENRERICHDLQEVFEYLLLHYEGRSKNMHGEHYGNVTIEWVESVRMRPCNEDCNHCPIINHPNNRMLTKVLNELHIKFGNGVYEIVQDNCPNFTVCYDCRIDDFCHSEGCEFFDK